MTIDELFFGEDICYKGGPLISPRMIRRFLLPYYQQLVANIKARQIDQARHLYIQIDTDGNPVSVIPLYREMGMDVMSPFEVAAGCDVVEIGREYPELVMTGGIDKRVLAGGPGRDRPAPRVHPACDAGARRVYPDMRSRRAGGSALRGLPVLPAAVRGVGRVEASFQEVLAATPSARAVR